MSQARPPLPGVARDHGIRQYIFSRTCPTCKAPDRLAVTEKLPQRPTNPYGASTLALEPIWAEFGTVHAMRSVAPCSFNDVGAKPGGKIDDDLGPKRHLISRARGASSGQRLGVTIFSAADRASDGTWIDGDVHVSDPIEAHPKARNAPQDDLDDIVHAARAWHQKLPSLESTVEIRSA